MEPSPTDRESRERWFAWYVDQINTDFIRLPKGATGPFHCPCCGCRTLDERGGYDICPVCFWEDDGQDSHDADAVRGGPNAGLSLSQARQNFREYGACERRCLEFVRPPRPDEVSNDPAAGSTRGEQPGSEQP